MKIFISGNPLSGKTTLVEKLVNDLGLRNFYGFYTKEVRDTNSNKRIGFDIHFLYNNNIEILPLARTDIKTNYRVGKYYVLKDNIDKIANILLTHLQSDNKLNNKILIIDEIGKMEMLSKNFSILVDYVLNNEISMIAVVHRNFAHRVPYYIWLNKYNWWDVYNKIKKEVIEFLKNAK